MYMKQKGNAVIVPLAWPDGLVASAYLKYDTTMSWFNLCKNGFYKAGHAAMLLIHTDTGEVQYFDFGRYIAQHKYGRIRSARTDHEIHFGIEAKVKDGEILNREEILQYTAAHPQTHGEGTLYAGFYPGFDFMRVLRHIERRQRKNQIRYGAFTVGGTNCSRFVAQTMAKFLPFGKKLQLLYPWYGTPSPLGNIFNSPEQRMYIAKGGRVREMDVSQWIRQYKILKKKITFGDHYRKKVPEFHLSRKGSFEPRQRPDNIGANAQWLGGTGSGAWHELAQQKDHRVLFRRVQQNGHVDTERWFVLPKEFDLQQDYYFQHGTDCSRLYIRQGETVLHFQPYTQLKRLVTSSRLSRSSRAADQSQV